jgi:coenzyme F420-reducing hydrogenase gamma subunit
MDDVLKAMKMRDCQGNIMKMQEEMRNLQATKHLNHFARLSHHKLASIRKLIPKEFLVEGVPNDYDRINLELLKEYLNKYAEKISRANVINPSNIKIDFGQFD